MTKSEFKLGELHGMVGAGSMMGLVDEFHAHLKLPQRQLMADIPESADADAALDLYADQFKSLSVRLLDDFTRRFPNDQRFVRLHLFAEETLYEMAQAFAARDEVKTLDALSDGLYVLMGCACIFDMPIGPGFVEVHQSNMTKEKQPEDEHKARVRQKGPSYVAPDLEGVLRSFREAQKKE